MKINEIKHIADIAQINFTEEELMGFEKDFSETMELIDKIREIDTDGVETTFHVNDTENNLRKDEVGVSFSQEEATKNTVDEKYGYFKIVRFVE